MCRYVLTAIRAEQHDVVDSCEAEDGQETVQACRGSRTAPTPGNRRAALFVEKVPQRVEQHLFQ
jgi:hypothetical protein